MSDTHAPGGELAIPVTLLYRLQAMPSWAVEMGPGHSLAPIEPASSILSVAASQPSSLPNREPVFKGRAW